MFKGPHFPRATKTCLHFIENQNDIVVFAPLGEFMDVFDGRKVRPDALIRFKNHTGDFALL